MAVLEGLPRSASVVALKPLYLYEINRENFNQLLKASPTFSQGIMRLLSARLREASNAVQRETLEKVRDPLTGLYNRHYMNSTLEHELQRANRAQYPVSLIMIDLDKFKQLNDTFGHLAGDQMLQSLGSLVQSQVRLADIACRYGGEEFLIILPETHIEVAVQRAETIRSAFAELRVSYEDQTLQGTLSVGVANFPDHGLTPEQVVQAADSALYAAKANGRNQVMIANPSR
jgi:diguanylate cyclase (GGDEF)-like protein